MFMTWRLLHGCLDASVNLMLLRGGNLIHELVLGSVGLGVPPAWILTFQGTELRGLLNIGRVLLMMF